jgi:serine/threonine-protein kinase
MAISAMAAWFLRPPPVEPKPVPVPVPVAVAIVDAGPPKVVEPLPAPLDAGLAVAGEPTDAGAPEPIDAGAPALAKSGRVEFRIRPYASVSIDGKPVGDTPMAPLTLPLGKHKVTLKNAELAKEVTVTLVVKPGTNVVKHNFKE